LDVCIRTVLSMPNRAQNTIRGSEGPCTFNYWQPPTCTYKT
jgi:hypothetical protein